MPPLCTRTRLGLWAPAVLIALAAACESEPERPKNVLLLVVDTLRADRLGCYGYARPTSPNIDALAARGTVYERNYSQASWTVPSMISMFTGVSVTHEEQAVTPSLATLAELLQRAGLDTAAFPANEVLGHDRGFERGFGWWDFTEQTVNADAQTLAQHFASWHASRAPAGESRPGWFAWVQFLDPHQPYKPKTRFDRFSGPRVDQERVEARWRSAEADALAQSPGLRGKSVDDAVAMMTHYSNLYDGEVLQSDDGIGAILETLRAAGELDETLVIVASDHGEMLFEQRLQPIFLKSRVEKAGGLPDGVADLFGCGHRSWFFEHLWNTPLVIAGPGIPAGARVGELSANLDILPTILEALDLPRPPGIEGESLFGGARPQRERVFAYSYWTSAVRERQGAKLVQHPPKYFLLPEDAEPLFDLYDLARDPHEEHSRGDEAPAEIERLRGEIGAWIARSEREAVESLTPQQLDAMRRLGYVDGK